MTHLLPVLLRALRQCAIRAQVLQLLRRQVERVRAPAAGAADRPRVVLLLLLLPLLTALGRAIAACRVGKVSIRLHETKSMGPCGITDIL